MKTIALTCKTLQDQALTLNIEFSKGRRIGKCGLNRTKSLKICSCPFQDLNSSIHFQMSHAFHTFQHPVQESCRRFAGLQ